MSHSVDTHRRSYEELDTPRGAASSLKLVKALLGQPSEGKSKNTTRKRFTDKEIIAISAYFAQNIADRKRIKMEQARAFLRREKTRSSSEANTRQSIIIKDGV